MKANTPLRILDLTLQLCMFFPLCLSKRLTLEETLICTYCSLGGAQLLSLAAHWLMNPSGRPRRRRYGRTVLGFLAPAILGFACLLPGLYGSPDNEILQSLYVFGAGTLILECFVLLFIAPFLAIWYFKICLEELTTLRAAVNHRREIHWKL